MTAEKKIENAIFDYLKSVGIFCWKQNTGGVYDPRKALFRKNKNKNVINGVADIIGVLPNGIMMAIEVKVDKTSMTRKTHASKDQVAFLASVNLHKGLAFVARSPGEVETVLVNLFGDKYKNLARGQFKLS